MKKLYRRCVVCGKRIIIVVYNDRHYRGGQYFNKFKVQVGRGEYKKVGTTKLAGRKVNVVKWTGREKEVEYWECENCYNEAMHECWLEEILKKLYGQRCPDYEKNCGCCQAWNVYDTIIAENRANYNLKIKKEKRK